MAETVDKWSILLTLSTLGFKRGISDIKSGTKDADKSVTDFSGSIKNIAVSAGAIIGLGATLKSFAGNAQQLDMLSVSTGENIKVLQAWKSAVDDMGVSGDGALSAINGLNAAMGRVRTTGFDPIVATFARLGVSVRDANGQFKQGSQLLRDFTVATQNLDERTASDFASQVGISQDTFYALRRAGSGIDSLIAKKRMLSNTTESDIEQNRQWQETISQLNNLWRSLANTVARIAIPAMRGLADAFGWLMQYKAPVYAMITGLIALIVGGLIVAAKAAIAPIITLGATLFAALSPVLAVIAPIIAGMLAIMYAIMKVSKWLGLLAKDASLMDPSSWKAPADKSRKFTGYEALQDASDTALHIMPGGSLIRKMMPDSRTTANAMTSRSTSNNSTSNVRIDNVKIETQSTDPRGIANDFYGELKIIGAWGGAR